MLQVDCNESKNKRIEQREVQKKENDYYDWNEDRVCVSEQESKHALSLLAINLPHPLHHFSFPRTRLVHERQICLLIISSYLSARVAVAGEVFVEWEGLRGKITRPDVRAVNGVIHVIDTVLMKKRDMTTSDSTATSSSSFLLSFALAFVIRALVKQEAL